jgi:pSer/pThr/pTyr-binding forkhead associated (FHA) protein
LKQEQRWVEMIICHQCQKSQPEGAIFCSECGSKLIDTYGLSTQNIVSSADLSEISGLPTSVLDTGLPEEVSRVTIKIVKTGDKIPLVGQDDFTIGRMSEGQSIIPDIDLSPYSAYQEGVSRIHAAIKVGSQEVNLIDLNSINGTSINEQKISPNLLHPLNNGDTITLGRFKFQVIIRE